MLLSHHDCTIVILYFLSVIVSSTSRESLGTDDVSSNENNRENNGRDHQHERKQLRLHKSLPVHVPAHDITDMTTDASSITTHSSASLLTVNLTSLPTQSSVSTSAASSTPAGPTFHPITAPSTNDTCQYLLEQYGKLASNFTNCAIVHAKPFLFCENCVKQYVETLEAYRRITEEEIHHCRDILLSSDRVMIVNQLHSFVKTLWEDGNCDSCFEDVSACHFNRTCSLSPETRNFMDSYQDTMECFDQYRIPASPAEHVYDVCQNCSSLYQKLNDRYEATGPLDKTCMDVVELMNHTRITWSSEYKCIQFKKDAVSVIALGCFVGLLPIFFYCGVRVHAVKQERKLIRQKRLSCAQGQGSIQAEIQYSTSS